MADMLLSGLDVVVEECEGKCVKIGGVLMNITIDLVKKITKRNIVPKLKEGLERIVKETEGYITDIAIIKKAATEMKNKNYKFIKPTNLWTINIAYAEKKLDNAHLEIFSKLPELIDDFTLTLNNLQNSAKTFKERPIISENL